MVFILLSCYIFIRFECKGKFVFLKEAGKCSHYFLNVCVILVFVFLSVFHKKSLLKPFMPEVLYIMGFRYMIDNR